jgi:hypothetical protein
VEKPYMPVQCVNHLLVSPHAQFVDAISTGYLNLRSPQIG